jgi:hypothetical protein
MNALGNQSVYFIRDLVNVEGVEYNLDEDILGLQGKRFELNKERGKSDRHNQPYKSTSVIVYHDGILFIGESNQLFSKMQRFFSKMVDKEGKKEWKKLLFEDMQSMQVLGDELRIRMNDDYMCNLKMADSKNEKKWELFICYLYENAKHFLNLKKAFKDHHYSCVKNNIGGQRKTKRSKRSKKCKRRTRRY